MYTKKVQDGKYIHFSSNNTELDMRRLRFLFLISFFFTFGINAEVGWGTFENKKSSHKICFEDNFWKFTIFFFTDLQKII